MVYLFLGADDFSKKLRIKQLAKLHKADLSFHNTAKPNLEDMAGETLFGGKRVFVLEGLISEFELERDLPALVKSSQVIVFSEEKLDKRKSATAAWLKYKDIEVEEFAAPQGPTLRQWVADRVKDMNSKIDTATINHFLNTILPLPSSNKFVEQKIDLWQLFHELEKLVTFANVKPITKEMVDELTTPNLTVESWDIANALAERNAKQAFLALEQFYADEDSGDDKAKTIQLNALLAEQFRSILMVQDFVSRGVPEAEILRQTGWKSGRLFIVRKLSSRFKPQELLSVLSKLELLDAELKSTTLPGRVVLGLIAVQLV
jgi:DNA polymerase III delta subunit